MSVVSDDNGGGGVAASASAGTGGGGMEEEAGGGGGAAAAAAGGGTGDVTDTLPSLLPTDPMSSSSSEKAPDMGEDWPERGVSGATGGKDGSFIKLGSLGSIGWLACAAMVATGHGPGSVQGKHGGTNAVWCCGRRADVVASSHTRTKGRRRCHGHGCRGESHTTKHRGPNRCAPVRYSRLSARARRLTPPHTCSNHGT